MKQLFDPTARIAWALVLGSAVTLEAIALYFQYGMHMDPCVLCVYQRSAVAGIALGGLVGLAWPRVMVFRLAGYLLIATAAVLGLRFAVIHVGVLGGASFDCSFLPEYPGWMPLHEWFPWLFQPTGMCDEIDWSLAGLNMPQVMALIFAAYLLALAYALYRELRRRHRPG